MNVSLLRHCESVFNENPQLHYDTKNCALSKSGVIQANALYGNYDIVYMSPLRRAIDTFMKSHIRSNLVEIVSDLREVKSDPCDFFDHEKVIPETDDEVETRVARLLSWILHLDPSKKYLLVGHSDIFWHLTAKCGSDGEMYGKWLENGEIVVLSDVKDMAAVLQRNTC